MHRADHERIAALVNKNKPGAATFRVVQNGGHDLSVNGQVPEEVLQTIKSWLQMVTTDQRAQGR
jgi:hypothetical protein